MFDAPCPSPQGPDRGALVLAGLLLLFRTVVVVTLLDAFMGFCLGVRLIADDNADR